MSDLNFEIFTHHGVISSGAFQKAIANSIYLLNQFDAGILHRGRGVLNWFVDSVRSEGNGNGQGPHRFSFHFVSELKKSKSLPKIPPNFAPSVTRELVHGVNEIETDCETPQFLSENAMEKVAEFGSMVQRQDVTGFRFSANQQVADITAQTATNVAKLTQKRTSSYGSVIGRLEELSIHGGYKARLYHELTNKVVTCQFANADDFNRAAAEFGNLVEATGELHQNLNGDTIRIIHPEIENLEGKPRFSWEEEDQSVMVLPSFADTPSTAEFMRRVRGD